MKIACAKEQLADAMSIVMRSVPKKSIIPVQECVLVEADTTIFFTANNNETAIRTGLYGMVLEKGAVAIPAALLNDIAKRLPDEDVYIESDENDVVSINCGKSKFKIAGMDGSDFVGMPPEVDGINADVDATVLANAVNDVIFCAGTDATQVMMTGINLVAKEDKLDLVALDGYRIAKKTIPIRSSDDFEVTIPARTLSEVTKIFKEGCILVTVDKNNVEFRSDDVVMNSRTIFGKFFDFGKIIGREHEGYVLADRKELMDAVNRATVVLKGQDKKPICVRDKR